MIKSGKMAVIGDRDSIICFKAIGADTFSAETFSEAHDTLRELLKQDYAVIFITEELCGLLESTLEKLKERTYPALIPIPSGAGSTGYAVKSMKKDVEKAIGADIIFNDRD